ncbi:MAG: NUDIX hydrolase [Bacteroidales bacterium]|nr:NUDIX hydrolase [Bacteroidales bacterium]
MYTYPYPRPAVTVDAVVFRKPASKAEILLIKRARAPFEGHWALPGGFIEMDETPEEAVLRELKEETGITGVEMKQLHTYGAVDRDPRHRTLSIAYFGLLSDNTQTASGADDAAMAAWYSTEDLPRLAFDHLQIVQDAIRAAGENHLF